MKRALVIIPIWLGLLFAANCYRVDRANREFMERQQARLLFWNAPTSPIWGDRIVPPDEVTFHIWRMQLPSK